MSTTNWIIAVVVVAILGVGAYYFFGPGADDRGAMMDYHGGQLRTNPNATGTDMMMSSSTNDQGGNMMNASGTVKVNVY